VIRLASANDIAAVTDIVNAAYSVYLPRIGRKPGPMLDDYAELVAAGRVHVLEHQGQIAGLVVLVPEGEVMLLDNVAVSPQMQGRGYGMKLIAFAEQSARAAGCSAIRLFTHELMTENQARYAYLGFVETHRGEEKGLKRVYMAKPLTA
jgi:N-acetylglutamate synthase-like GNAT family acetyltransferase